MPRSRASRASRRVSSAATMSARASSSQHRAEASPGLPSGAPTSTTHPVVVTAHPQPTRVGEHLSAAYDRVVSMVVVTGDRPGAETGQPRSADGVDDSIRRRLATVPRDTWRSWLACGWVVAIAVILRFVNLGLPN